MRNQRINVRKFLIIVLCCSVFLTGCFIHLPEPPSKDEIETWFRENREDITLVTKELLQLDCDTCFVTDAYDRVVDYENAWVPIDNQAFFPAVNRLCKAGCFQIAKQEGNTVQYTMSNKFGGVFSGLAYSPDYKVPNVQFLTECELIEGETEWYYFVDDYEKWRVSGTPAFHFGDDGQ